MRILLVLLLFTNVSFSQCSTVYKAKGAKNYCNIEMTLGELQSKNLSFKCSELFDNKKIKIENFRIKVPGNPTLSIKGKSLDIKSKSFLKKYKRVDPIIIWDFDYVIIDNEKYPAEGTTIMIKVVN